MLFLIVPRDIAYDVLIRAEEIYENEKKIWAELKKANQCIALSTNKCRRGQLWIGHLLDAFFKGVSFQQLFEKYILGHFANIPLL